ncbi:MAG: hypothetical protein QXX95_05955 [Nitrososphaerales archaeon]
MNWKYGRGERENLGLFMRRNMRLKEVRADKRAKRKLLAILSQWPKR